MLEADSSYSFTVGVRVLRSGDTIVAEVVETISIDQAFELLDTMAELAQESGAQRGLIVIDQASALLDTLDRHKLGIHAARVLPRTMWLAVAAPRDLITPMFESTARNRGLTVRVFDNLSEAEAWLASD